MILGDKESNKSKTIKDSSLNINGALFIHYSRWKGRFNIYNLPFIIQANFKYETPATLRGSAYNHLRNSNRWNWRRFGNIIISSRWTGDYGTRSYIRLLAIASHSILPENFLLLLYSDSINNFGFNFGLVFDSDIEVCILFVCRLIALRSSANFIIPLKIRYYIVGAVFDAEDGAKNNRKIFKNAVKDLRPETRARIVKILNTWNGRASEKELEEILGNQRANRLRKLVDTSTGELTSNEVDNLRRLFKESVTFD